jgi:hypothetical protein
VDRTIIKHRDHQQEHVENGGRHSGEQEVGRNRAAGVVQAALPNGAG